MTDSDATQGDNMSPAEFAKLMGAYPQPAENPLPAYGGYMDNSAANFSWVQNNDYYGAESFNAEIPKEFDCKDEPYDHSTELNNKGFFQNLHDWSNTDDMGVEYCYNCGQYALTTTSTRILSDEEYQELRHGYAAETFEAEKMGWDIKEYGNKEKYAFKDGVRVIIAPIRKSSYQYHPRDAKWKLTYGRDTPHGVVPLAKLFGTYGEVFRWLNNPPFEVKSFGAESFEAEKTGKMNLTMKELLVLILVNRDWEDNDWETDDEGRLNASFYHDDVDMKKMRGVLSSLVQKGIITAQEEYVNRNKYTMVFVNDKYTTGVDDYEGSINWNMFDCKDEIVANMGYEEFIEWASTVPESIVRGIAESKRAESFNGLSAEEYYAEMEELDDGVASITNRFGDSVGVVQVDDEDLEDVSVEITDGDGDVVYEGILGDEDVPEMEDDYYLSENKKKSSILPMALGVAGAIFAYQPVMDFLSSKYKKEEKMAENPELIENPNTGNLDPAQYEEMVVESTGYAVDVIPQVLDGSFMGSRFAALPTERYVEYSDPGIGAHTDIAMNRDEMYLEPEMAMVQASESVKESQAPGQSPYNSTTGEENPDFDVRVLKETTVVSLDPAVKPFIPQSMSGYTGNANTPPSVYDKMFNIGVLGQTPSFVPGSGDIGSSHTGSRSAIPNSLGIAGVVGGPLSDQVNANYTDGQTSMSLAQWAIENTVSQTSDTEAVVIDRSSGAMKRVRRV